MSEQEDVRNQNPAEQCEADEVEYLEPVEDKVRQEEDSGLADLSALPLSDSALESPDVPMANVEAVSESNVDSDHTDLPKLEVAIERLVTEVSNQSAQLETIAISLFNVDQRLAALENRPSVSPLDMQQLEREMQKLSADGLIQSKRSLLKDVLGLYDLAISMAHAVDARETISLDEFSRRLLLVAEQMAQLLQLNGLEIIPADPGTRFDPKLHFAEKGVFCEEASMHHTIKEVHALGFRGNKYVFRPTAVDVWVWDSPADEKSVSSEDSVAPDQKTSDTPQESATSSEKCADEPAATEELEQENNAEDTSTISEKSSDGTSADDSLSWPDDLVEDCETPEPTRNKENQS